MDDLVLWPLVLPLFWRRRLQRLARTCSTAPGKFAREAVEADIVRRALLIAPGDTQLLGWLGESNAPSVTQLH